MTGLQVFVLVVALLALAAVVVTSRIATRRKGGVLIADPVQPSRELKGRP